MFVSVIFWSIEAIPGNLWPSLMHSEILFQHFPDKASVAWVFQNELSSSERLEELHKYRKLEDRIGDWNNGRRGSQESYQLGCWDQIFHSVSKFGPGRITKTRVLCLCEWTLVLLTSRCESDGEKRVKNLDLSAWMIDSGEKNPSFTNYGPFFTASNAQKIKVESIFHKWEDQMI